MADDGRGGRRTGEQVVARWAHLWNTDHRSMVLECYAADAIGESPGYTYARGHDQLMVVEDTLAEAAPRRYMVVDRVIDGGRDQVVLGVVRNPDQGEGHSVPFCIVLSLGADDRIVHDRTFSDLTRWPRISEEARERCRQAGVRRNAPA